jgi:hypothetical protein
LRNGFPQLIGWTPLVELKRIASEAGIDARIVGKMEAYQPLCSIKDRSALRSHPFPFPFSSPAANPTEYVCVCRALQFFLFSSEE